MSVLLITAVILNGLLAGLYFAFTVAVVPGLSAGRDEAFVEGFRSINAVILNGWFLSVFALAPVTAIVVAVWSALAGFPGTWALVTAAAFAAATMLITVAFNVPLNDALAAAVPDSAETYRLAREAFEDPWARWNMARTLTGTAALLLLAVGATR